MANFYIVGGYNRDKLMGKQPKDIDYCVTGTTPEEMIEKGFKQVGADFPVFLDKKGDEYALARTERKTGKKYHDFETNHDPSVTIEDDLFRRDLTINAIALNSKNEYIDPFNGISDIKTKKLRHVSEAFKEDPLRILRIARFSARLPDFTIAKETRQIIKDMIDSGEIDNLVPERIFLETMKALKEDKPSRYFETLAEVGALKKIFPELENLRGVSQPAQHHPEIDSFIHTMMVLDQSAKLTDNVNIRFCALVHDLGKALTPKELLPAHHGHEVAGVPLTESLCKRLKTPSKLTDYAKTVTEFHGKIRKWKEMNPNKIDNMFMEMKLNKEDALDRLECIITASEADIKGRLGFDLSKFPEKYNLKYLFLKWKEIKPRTYYEEKGLNIKDIDKEKIQYDFRNRRIQEIRNFVKKYDKNQEKSLNM